MASSQGERKFTAEGIAAGVRIDGRSRLEYRDLILETDLLPQCHGSARATIPTDNTDVLASVKVEIDTPDSSDPSEAECGSVDVSASIWASVSSSLASGRAADDFSALLTRTLQT
jgi:exosome complex component RRP42